MPGGAREGPVAVDVGATVEKAWRLLPAPHRRLLESIGADRWEVVNEPLGALVTAYRVSAGLPSLPLSAEKRLARAYGVWIKELRVMLIQGQHPGLIGLSREAAEAFVARLAWHEWGHALSVERCTDGDVFEGRRFLGLCPPGVAGDIRAAGYGPGSFTHEIVAEVYALLMERSQRGGGGRPAWLHQDIYDLVRRVAGWTT